MSGASGFFAQSYAQAREAFLSRARARGLGVETHVHPETGRDGELLAMDVARDGPADADAVLVVSSACHGVEGFCGSGAQGALLADDALHGAAATGDVAILYIHALNPYGFSWWRRTTQENVDLNRNFVDFDAHVPANASYDAMAAEVVPESWPPDAENVAFFERYLAAHGARAWQEAVSSGQYAHATGLFYGGAGPTWSHLTLRRVLAAHGRRCRRLGWVDLHTGLGPRGVGEKILATRDDPAAAARARGWWGDVTSIYDGTSSSALLTGLMWHAAYEESPQAEYTGIALEYGTLPPEHMIDALRADQWLQNHPDADRDKRVAIKQLVRDAFYVDADDWKEQVVAQAIPAVYAAVQGLSAGR